WPSGGRARDIRVEEPMLALDSEAPIRAGDLVYVVGFPQGGPMPEQLSRERATLPAEVVPVEVDAAPEAAVLTPVRLLDGDPAKMFGLSGAPGLWRRNPSRPFVVVGVYVGVWVRPDGSRAPVFRRADVPR